MYEIILAKKLNVTGTITIKYSIQQIYGAFI
jgi:hypothetical protein